MLKLAAIQNIFRIAARLIIYENRDDYKGKGENTNAGHGCCLQFSQRAHVHRSHGGTTSSKKKAPLRCDSKRGLVSQLEGGSVFCRWPFGVMYRLIVHGGGSAFRRGEAGLWFVGCFRANMGSVSCWARLPRRSWPRAVILIYSAFSALQYQ